MAGRLGIQEKVPSPAYRISIIFRLSRKDDPTCSRLTYTPLAMASPSVFVPFHAVS